MGNSKQRKTKGQLAEERRQRNIRIAIGAFIIVLMVASTIGFVVTYYAPDNPQNSGGVVPTTFPYRVQDNIIYADMNGKVVPFYTFPDTAIIINPEAARMVRESAAFGIAFDPSDEENAQFVELVRFDLASYIDTPSLGLLMAPSDKYALPEGSCLNATAEIPVLQIINGTPGVTVENNCITLSGDQVTLLATRDQFLYTYFGVRE